MHASALTKMLLILIGGLNNSATSGLIDEWIKTQEPERQELIKKSVGNYFPDDFNQIKQELRDRRARTDSSTHLTLLNSIYKELQLVEQGASPDDYGPSEWTNALAPDSCYSSNPPPQCATRTGGFAAAAYAQLRAGWQCWKVVEVYNDKGFQAGVKDWWSKYAQQKDTCEQPVRPARCVLAKCFGGTDGYDFGFGLRPSAQLGFTVGSGLGFNNGSFGGQFSTSLGARFFLFGDWLDIHGGFGFAGAVSAATNAVGYYAIAQAGLGTLFGLIGVDWIHSFDMAGAIPDGANYGNGLSIYIDAANIDKLVGKFVKE